MIKPSHIAIIMDGNGRWAKKQGLARREGHKKGVSVLKDIVKVAAKNKIKTLSVYAFSTENWSRPEFEVNFLLKLFSETLNKEMESLHKQNVKVDIIGRKNNLPSSLQDNIRKIEKLTKNNSELNLNIAFNYGGRAEIVDTCKKFIAEGIRKENISEKLISNNLYNNNISDIEILIRTGGDRRISNFLLWEIAYAELYFIEKYWPEFTTDDFELIIKDFQKRERRFGGLKEAGE